MAVAGVLSDLILPPYTVGSKGGPGFDTVVVATAGGREQRMQNRARSAGRWEIGFADGSASQADIQELVAFAQVTQGKAYGFLMLDYLDYQSASSPGDALLNPTTGTNVADGTTTVWQLQRVYKYTGLYGGAGASESVTRKITRPLAATVQIWESTNSGSTWSQLMSGWTLSSTGGQITFSSAPTSGYWLSAVFQFYVPVRFEEDLAQMSLEGIIGGWEQIGLMEILE